MKHTLILLVLLWFSTGYLFAQKKDIAVSGQVIETDTKEPVEMATVQLLALPDSVQAAGITTGKQGRFTLPKVKSGKYLLKVSFVGYITRFLPLTLSDKSLSRNVGSVTLTPDDVLLDEAVVTAEAPPVVIKADTTEYSASAFRVSAGAVLEDLIKKIPGTEIDADGKITLNGEEIKKIMVNGKDFFGGDTEMSLKNLPADAVNKIKAYKKQSDRERQTGIKDGKEEPVLDLTLKKNSGWMGNIVAGYGSKDRYEGGVMANHFTDDVNMSLIGTANNTNGRGFSELGDAARGMEGGRNGGLTTVQTGGFTYAKKKDKLDIRGNIRYRHNDREFDVESSNETLLGNESTFSNSRRTNKSNGHNLNGDFQVEWKIDSLSTLTFSPNFNYSKNSSLNDSWNKTLNGSKEPVNETTSAGYGDHRNMVISGTMSYNRRFKKQRRNLHVSVNVGYNNNSSENFNDSYSQFFERDSISDIERRNVGKGDSRNYNLFAMYSEPISKHYILSLGYNYSHSKGLSQSLVYDSINYEQRFNLDFNNELSSKVENFYDDHNLNLSLQGDYVNREKDYTGLSYNVGVGINPKSTRSETTIGPNAFKDLPRQNVVNWSPNLRLEYAFSSRERLHINYNGNSNAPNLLELQEVIDVTDPMNLRYGNPNLKPSFSNNVYMGYNRYSPKSMRSINANVNYRNTMNSVVDRMTYDKETGARTYHKVNVNGNWSTGGWISFTTPFKNKKFNLSANVNLNYGDQMSYTTVNQEGMEMVLSTTHNFSTGERIRGSYRSDKFDVSINASFRYNNIYNNKQKNSNRETFDYTIGGDANVKLPWDIELSTDVNYRLKDGYSGNGDNDELMWNAQVSKKFLRKKQAMIRFKVYDILQQQSNLFRWVSGTSISDTRYNTLTSYCMLHFVYRFNSLGGKR